MIPSLSSLSRICILIFWKIRFILYCIHSYEQFCCYFRECLVSDVMSANTDNHLHSCVRSHLMKCRRRNKQQTCQKAKIDISPISPGKLTAVVPLARNFPVELKKVVVIHFPSYVQQAKCWYVNHFFFCPHDTNNGESLMKYNGMSEFYYILLLMFFSVSF